MSSSRRTAALLLMFFVAGCSHGPGSSHGSEPSSPGGETFAADGVTRARLRVAIRTRAYGEQIARRTDGPIIRPVVGDHEGDEVFEEELLPVFRAVRSFFVAAAQRNQAIAISIG